jgi:iron(III) transport system substrate-binding protein
VLKQVAGGEKLFGMVVDFMAIREKAKGAPVAFVFPKEGVSAIGEPVAILKSTKNAEAARAFLAFLLSSEGAGARAQAGLYPGASPGSAAGGLSRAARTSADGLRSGAGAGRGEGNTRRFSDIFGP